MSVWGGGSHLKSMHISLVLVTFRHRYDLSHHLTKSCNTGPWLVSSLYSKLSKAVSSENLIKYLLEIRIGAPTVVCVYDEPQGR